jgi:hypothetical protein
MPFMKLKTSPVTSSHSPHNNSAARVRSVRGARQVAQSPATSRISAAGSSQAICPPISELNIRVQPVSPHMLPMLTLPVSEPLNRPNPL